MFRCPLWKWEKTLQKGNINPAGKCSFMPGSQEGKALGRQLSAGPTPRDRRLSTRWILRREKKCRGTLEKMSLVHNWSDRHRPFSHHRRATLPWRNVFVLRGTRCHLVRSMFTGEVPWLSAWARDLENPSAMSETHILHLRLCLCLCCLFLLLPLLVLNLALDKTRQNFIH